VGVWLACTGCACCQPFLFKPTLNSRRCFIAGAPALFRWPTSGFVILSSRHTL
jgi:hypothetical protein